VRQVRPRPGGIAKLRLAMVLRKGTDVIAKTCGLDDATRESRSSTYNTSTGRAASGRIRAPAGLSQPAKPNFTFFFADDLGWGDLGRHGNRSLPMTAGIMGK